MIGPAKQISVATIADFERYEAGLLEYYRKLGTDAKSDIQFAARKMQEEFRKSGFADIPPTLLQFIMDLACYANNKLGIMAHEREAQENADASA